MDPEHHDDEPVSFPQPFTPDPPLSGDDVELMAEVDSDLVPLLGGQRRPTTFHWTFMSLFATDHDYSMIPTSSSLSSRARRYFRPMIQRKYYEALLHLLVINFPYELAAWVYLFVGTLAGTASLITLPLGATICFLTLLGARALARGEIFLQTRFHRPLSVSPLCPPRPIFARMRSPAPGDTVLEPQHSPAPVPETSFLRLSFLMFRDPSSYQALFYFLVVKPGLTLLLTIALLILVPPAFILVLPAPAVLRAVRRVGIWQAEVAVDSLLDIKLPLMCQTAL